MKKEFTLIELLAVIAILSVITLITVPMITNVIEESKKKALMSSVEGLVESANLYAIENDGVYEFLFDKEHQGSILKGESLDYRGTIDGEGKLYLDKEGNTSICISNNKYYVYKNYNSGIIVGDKKTGNCIIGFDALTNKYVAMLDNGTGNVSNVYSKDEVNNLVDAKAIELDNKITNNTSEITNLKSNIEELQNHLNNYTLQSELEKTNTNIEHLSSIISSHTSVINQLNSNGDFTQINKSWNSVQIADLSSGGQEFTIGKLSEKGRYLVLYQAIFMGPTNTGWDCGIIGATGLFSIARAPFNNQTALTAFGIVDVTSETDIKATIFADGIAKTAYLSAYAIKIKS